MDNKDLKFIRGKVIYPNTVGYTGYAIQNKTPVLYIHPKYRDKDYIDHECKIEDEIDNFFQEPEISCALYFPIIDHKCEIQGVLQLINFLHGPYSISKRQMKEIEITCEIIGTSLCNLKEITDIMICSTNLYDNLTGIYEKVSSKLADYVDQIDGELIRNNLWLIHFLESIRNISRCVQDFVTVKKMQLFKDKILMSTYAEYEIEEKIKEKARIQFIKKKMERGEVSNEK